MSKRKLTTRAMGFVLCLGLVVLANVGVESIASTGTNRQSTLTLTVPPKPRQSTLTLTVPPKPRQSTLTLTVPPRP